MNYIPYPRLDKNTHLHLEAWRAKAPKNDGDWTALKLFLNDCTKIGSTLHTLPKCWFSELPQGDDYALDVEHFRPKNSGNPLTSKQIKLIEKYGSVKYQQEITNGTYPWLEFDYRNYRLVTAKTNRAGAKHIYFPIALGANRITNGTFPWDVVELAYFLDPTNKQDTKLLYVKPNGEIAPSTPITELSQEDYDALPNSWRNNGFNYLRAIITIVMFNLNYRHFITGRYIVYSETTREMGILEKLLIENLTSEIIPNLVENISNKVLPSSPFSLAAKSALIAYQSKHPNQSVKDVIERIKSKILLNVENEVNKITIDWNRP